MIDISIIIDKENVKSEVKKLAAYEGAKNQTDDNQTYERLFISEQEWEVLEQTMVDASKAVATILADRLKSVSETSETGNSRITFALSMTDNFMTTMVPYIKTAIESYYIQYLTGKWMSIANKNAAEIFITRADNFLSDAKSLLCKRIRPVRKNLDIKNDYEITVEQ